MAFSGNLVWEVRTSGNSNNGGAFRGTSLAGTPSAPTVTGFSSGGTVAAGTYYVVITYTPGGEIRESPISGETSVTVSGATSRFVVTKPTDPGNGATWNVYVATASGGPYFPQGTSLAIGSDRSVTTTPPTTGTQPAGVDYSQQDAAQFSLTTASTVHSTTTQINVAVGDHTVSANDVGNIFNNTGGSATVQRLEITAVDIANNRWTVDKAAGTSGQTLTGSFGGAVAHPSNIASVVVGSNIMFIKYNATAYTFTSGLSISGSGVLVIGYDSTRTVGNNDANRPILRTGANSITLFSGFAQGVWRNLSFDNPSSFNSNTGIVTGGNSFIYNCKFDTIKQIAINLNNQSAAIDCEFVSCGSANLAANVAGASSFIQRCIFRSCSTAGASAVVVLLSGNGSSAIECVITGTTGGGTAMTLGAAYSHAYRCVVHNNTGGVGSHGFTMSAVPTLLEACIAYGNAGWGINTPTATTNQRLTRIVRCATGNNTLGHINPTGSSIDQQISCVTLSGDPFIDATSFNFGLNGTSGAGASCRDIPVVFPGGTMTSYTDIGAVQHAPTSNNVGIKAGGRI